MNGLFASFMDSRFSRPEISARLPTSCPYCPGTLGCHWTMAATYPRYYGHGRGSERIRVQRYKCKIKCRTFSLLPDGLFPYHHPTSADILNWLEHLLIHEHGETATAQFFSVARITIKRVGIKFGKAVKILRLPGHDGVLAPAAFLRRLATLGADSVINLFAKWKQLEPKHSLVGMYPR